MKTGNVLLVEGKDDCHVVWSLLAHHSVPQTFTVKDAGGVESLLSTIPIQIKGSGVTAVGVVVDADFNIAARWDSLKHIVEAAGYQDCPTTPAAEGTILETEGLPRLGIWLMPDNVLPGMLEDFVSLLIPDDDDLWPIVAECVEAIPDVSKRFTPQHTIKAKIHTWLSWQNDPGTPMGLAITKKYLDGSSPTAVPFISWVNQVF